MKLDLLDIEKLIEVNKLEEVTSANLFSSKMIFDPDGLLSNEIFGISKGDRRTTFAYIECYFILAVIYLLLTLLASFVLKLIEKRLDGEKISLNPFRMMRKKRL